jgi:hypothetical protein
MGGPHKIEVQSSVEDSSSEVDLQPGNQFGAGGVREAFRREDAIGLGGRSYRGELYLDNDEPVEERETSLPGYRLGARLVYQAESHASGSGSGGSRSHSVDAHESICEEGFLRDTLMRVSFGEGHSR